MSVMYYPGSEVTVGIVRTSRREIRSRIISCITGKPKTIAEIKTCVEERGVVVGVGTVREIVEELVAEKSIEVVAVGRKRMYRTRGRCWRG